MYFQIRCLINLSFGFVFLKNQERFAMEFCVLVRRKSTEPELRKRSIFEDRAKLKVLQKQRLIS
jgi:hypothetical protein